MDRIESSGISQPAVAPEVVAPANQSQMVSVLNSVGNTAAHATTLTHPGTPEPAGTMPAEVANILAATRLIDQLSSAEIKQLTSVNATLSESAVLTLELGGEPASCEKYYQRMVFLISSAFNPALYGGGADEREIVQLQGYSNYPGEWYDPDLDELVPVYIQLNQFEPDNLQHMEKLFAAISDEWQLHSTAHQACVAVLMAKISMLPAVVMPELDTERKQLLFCGKQLLALINPEPASS